MSQHTVIVADNAVALDDHQDRQVDIRITSAKLEELASPETIVRLIVERQDGQQAIFFVTVRLCNRGMPHAALIAKKADGSEVSKAVHGYWKAARIS
jgi:hypothetical protein